MEILKITVISFAKDQLLKLNTCLNTEWWTHFIFYYAKSLLEVSKEKVKLKKGCFYANNEFSLYVITFLNIYSSLIYKLCLCFKMYLT